MNLETNRLLLRKLTIPDAERIEELAGDFDVAKTTLTIPFPYPKGSAVEFINSMLQAEQQERLVMFAVIEKNTNSLIGIINISIAHSHKRGELAYWVGKPYWGCGYGTEAAKVVMEYGFKHLDLNKIYAQAFTTNPGSWRIMEKIGLNYEGTLKQHVFRFNENYDLAQYGLLREEYLNKIKR
jgi:[ribosomal protein S5]-alanine N-acetyltransferase